MRKLQFAIPATILMGGLLLNLTPSFGKAEYTKLEKKPCVTCHVTAKSKELNKVGECYGKKKSLKECPTK
jgi:hypothetical protein